ncbi:hydroxypyruvate reductase (plasmid) [Maritalea myrionectae]|uniref:Hydroxypyruvate reductase n=1 Tax=Maritalea myrionectae TaxID=454601 RepID=A0A2R4MJR7_9HYPH|nr:glycerate kinase [Maritalea myrionectae]AVX06223.1 hydroxypyruvate reductase [Maritalea myrionectae]
MQSDATRLLKNLFEQAVATADPMNCLAAHLPPPPEGRLIVIGAGKASARMAEAVERHYDQPLEGLVITRYGYGRPTQQIEIVEAAHPVPDQAGVDATRRILHLVDNLTPDDLVLALISGGGSSLLCAPRDGLSLKQKQQINKDLLASGAPISQMNVVRRHLSQVKGGKLAAACAPAQVLGLIISDVPGDDVAVIASGPTVPQPPSADSVSEILERWGIDPAAFAQLPADPDQDFEALKEKVSNKVVAAPSQSLAAAKTVAEQVGCDVLMLGDDLEGEARELGAAHAHKALEIAANRAATQKPLLILSGGECTVTRTGNGVGGPNAEYALAALIALNGNARITLLAADTDGVDGAAEVAGAFVLPDSLQRATDLGRAPQDYLQRNDAHHFFEALGDQFITGPTLTNVNDFRAILIE